MPAAIRGSVNAAFGARSAAHQPRGVAIERVYRTKIQIGRTRNHGCVPDHSAIHRAQKRAARAASPYHHLIHRTDSAQRNRCAARLRHPGLSGTYRYR